MSVAPALSAAIGRPGGRIRSPTAHPLEHREGPAGAGGERPIGEQHDEYAAIRIDPQRGAGPDGVAKTKRTERAPRATHRFYRGHGLPPQRPRLRPATEVGGRGGEQADGFGPEQAAA